MRSSRTGRGEWRERVHAILRRLRERPIARREPHLDADAEVTPIAGKLGMSAVALRALAWRSPHAAGELPRILEALGLDVGTTARRYPILLRDLQRVCASCRTRTRCNRELACNEAAAHFEAFCPNRETLRALL